MFSACNILTSQKGIGHKLPLVKDGKNFMKSQSLLMHVRDYDTKLMGDRREWKP